MFKGLIEWYLQSLGTGGYPLIVLLMAIESSILPLPSELVIPPAALLAHKQGTLSMAGIVMAGAVGSWLGATVMYWASRLAGRPLVLRYGRFFLVPPRKVEAAELWANRFGAWGILLARLLPVVRHLIGIPAGVVRMSYGQFSLYTLIGSAVWCAVLCWVGVLAGKDERLMRGELHRLTLWLVGTVAVLALMYYFLVVRFMKPRAASGGDAGRPIP